MQVRADGARPSDATGICSLSGRHVHLECIAVDFLIVALSSLTIGQANYKYLEPYDNGNVPAHRTLKCIVRFGGQGRFGRKQGEGFWVLGNF